MMIARFPEDGTVRTTTLVENRCGEVLSTCGRVAWMEATNNSAYLLATTKEQGAMSPANGPMKPTTPSLPTRDRDRISRALIVGEQSGEPERFDFAAFKRRKLAEMSG